MADVTNKTLAILLVGAIVVSLMGTLISLNRVSQISPFPARGPGAITGMAFTNEDNGTVQLNVQSTASLAVRRSINFGAITPNSTRAINISSDANLIGEGGAVDCTVVQAGGCSGLELENDGNIPINVTMNTTSSPADLIGGTGPEWKFYVASGNSSTTRGDTGCTHIPGSWGTPWQAFSNHTRYRICNSTVGAGFWFNDSNDTLTVEFNLTIPSDAPTGSRTATIMFWNDDDP